MVSASLSLISLIVLRVIQDLVAQIICNAGAFYKASESVSICHFLFSSCWINIQVALLDMLWAFAHVSISGNLLLLFLALH